MMIFPDSSSVLCTTAWLLLFLWLQAQVHQRRNGQNVVRRNILEEELQALAEYHKETLLAESNVSTIRYRPITMNGQIPLTSSCRYEMVDWRQSYCYIQERRSGYEEDGEIGRAVNVV